MEYICPRCHYTTKHRGHFIRHIHNKRICDAEYADISLELVQREFLSEGLKTYRCDSCKKCFKTRSGISYHRPICKESSDVDKEDIRDIEIVQLKEEVEKLKTIVHVRDAPPHIIQTEPCRQYTQIINNHGAFDNSHHQHVHIHLNAFGNESRDHITKEFAIECFQKGAYGILDMLDKIYFDENTPENHNIKIRSLKNMLVEVFKDPHWEVRGFHDTVDGMISTSRNEIIKDINCTEIINNNDELLYTLQNILNPPLQRVKNIKEHTKARLVQRREDISISDTNSYALPQLTIPISSLALKIPNDSK